MRTSPLDRHDRWIALGLALGVFLILIATEGSLAVGWDEPIYIENGQRIAIWLGTFLRGLAHADLSEALDPTNIGLSFGLNHEHPPIAKAISGLGWALTRRWLPLPTAHRVGPMALAAALVALIYIAVRQAGAGKPAAIAGALALLGMPRLFFHAHVAGLDLPAAAMWFFATWAFRRLHERRYAWAWLGSGLAFGLALSTKISNVLIPISLGVWILTDRRRLRRWGLWGRLAVLPPLGLLTVIVLFPWFWSDTVPKLIEWVRFFTVSHYEIYQYYLGKTYLELPWHYPYVIVLTTTPALILALAILGATRAFKPGVMRSAAQLWLIQALT
ncbi:MAG: glycosyltransferase family 39 protein, partial [Anaerolineae bacterium]|nr:glycosyltransferase family 39 protein [Anaerolineae bacterium]